MPHRVIRRAAVAPLPLLGLRGRHLETSVGRIHVLESEGGDAARLPLIIVHGFASSSLDYVPLIMRLRGEVGRIAAPDLPAHGLSEVPRTGLGADTLRTGLRETLDALIGDRPAVLYGNSMGGQGVIRYARRRPEKVAGIILSSPGGARMTEAELEAFIRVFRVDDEQTALVFLDRLLARRPRLLRKLLALHVRRKLSRDVLQRLLDRARPVDLLDPDEVSGLTVPTLVLWGQQERLLPDEHLAFFERHLPAHARMEKPPAFGHAPHVEHVPELAQRVRRYLRELEMQRVGLAAVPPTTPALPAFSPDQVRP